MNREEEFDELGRNKSRYQNFVYYVDGTPIDGDHERYLQKASLSAENEEVLNDFDAEDHAQSSPTRHSLDLQASKKTNSKPGLSRRTLPNASAKLAGKTIGKSRAIQDDDLDANEMIVNLSFQCPTGPEQKHEGSALLDTGVEDDWIAESSISTADD